MPANTHSTVGTFSSFLICNVLFFCVRGVYTHLGIPKIREALLEQTPHINMYVLQTTPQHRCISCTNTCTTVSFPFLLRTLNIFCHGCMYNWYAHIAFEESFFTMILTRIFKWDWSLLVFHSVLWCDLLLCTLHQTHTVL